jgi:predicted nucleotidyltransferase
MTPTNPPADPPQVSYDRFGLPVGTLDQILHVLGREPRVERIVLYGSRALGRQRPGSDVDLCLEAPALKLGDLLALEAELDGLLLPWRVDLQLHHRIDHPALLESIERAGIPLTAVRPD